MVSNFPIDYSKTQRILLLIDLSPILHLQNPNSYFNSILSSANTILKFTSLSNSLSSFKLFFSCLSPILSYSALQKLPFLSYNPNSLSFNHPFETLDLLSETLNIFPMLENGVGLGSGSGPKGCFMASSIVQITHDYGWDLCDTDCNVEVDLAGNVRSNLVVLFSPVCRSLKGLYDFMGFVCDDNDVVLSDSDSDSFNDKFKTVFGHVRDAFVSRDIHFCWVDVRSEIESSTSGGCRGDGFDEYGKLLRLFRSGVKGLGWSFVLSDSIVLGSALVSFGLIYPMIGVTCIPGGIIGDGCKKVTGQLNLEILDVRGKPLECKYCDVQLLDFKMDGGCRVSRLPFQWENGKVKEENCHQLGGIWEGFSDGVVKIEVKAVRKHSEFMKIEENAYDVILVHELLAASKKNKGESYGEYFADRVLDMLSDEMSESIKRKSPPLWQILLCFLYRRGYWAEVSLSNVNGAKKSGVLKPFNVHSALLLILKHNTESYLSEQNVRKMNIETGDNTGGFDIGGESKRRNKKQPHRYKDLSWTSFCNLAYKNCDMELEEAYISKGCDTSKKLKFLKCWMKQVVKNGHSLPPKLDMTKVHSADVGKIEEKLGHLHHESKRLYSSFPNNPEKETHIDEATTSGPQAAEAFFSDLSERILHGIESGVDLAAFSHRVVCSCIYWFSQKLGVDTKEESQVSTEKSDCNSSRGRIAGEIIKILLKDPKDFVGKDKDVELTSKVHDTKPSISSSNDRIRQYELQILFRMEILQSEVAVGMVDSVKHKFVRQICLLLEFIQCNMEDGFFGDFNLNDYVRRTISSRYAKTLPGVVHRIYERLDLLLFDEEESPNLLFNSDNDRSEHNSTDDSFSEPRRKSIRNPKETAIEDDDHKLVEARERRERALRFSSFTRRTMPEMQRVWAPKQVKVSRSNSESIHREVKSKRKSRRESYDMVCETPMSGAKKCLFPSDDITGKDENVERGGGCSGSVYKALFQF